MPVCRTRKGTLRVVFEGQEYWLDSNGRELPEELAESIRPHVNVIVDDPSPPPAPEPPKRKNAPSA